MLRGRVVTEKPLEGRRSRLARHSRPYWVRGQTNCSVARNARKYMYKFYKSDLVHYNGSIKLNLLCFPQ